MALGYGRTGTNNFSTAVFIVDTNGIQNGATHSTIAAAITDASAGSTIVIKPGTYTENVSITKDLNICCWPTGARSDNNISPIIAGKFTVSASTHLKLFGFELQTNGDNIVNCDAAGAKAQLINCSLDIETAVTAFSIGTSTSNIQLYNCFGSGAGTAKLFAATAGNFRARYCWFESLGADSTTATDGCLFQYCNVEGAGVTTSGTGFLVAEYTHFGSSLGSGTNTTWLTNGGATSRLAYCRFLSGTSTCIVVNSGIVNCRHCNLSTSNTNVVSGAGTFNYAGLTFEGSSRHLAATTLGVNYEGPSKTIGSSNSGNTNTLTVTNDSNTATSSSNIISQVAGGTASDATYQAVVSGAQTWTWGVDNGSSDSWNLAASSALGTTDVMISTTAGEITKPLQPAFLAVNSASDANQTGAGTVATVEFDTEVFDQNGDFNNTTDTFTAPVTGRYQFNVSAGLANMTSSMTRLVFNLVTSNRTYQIEKCNPYAQQDGTNGQYVCNGSVVADMDASDTATVTVAISNGAGDTASIIGGNNNTFFSGCLLA